jgi:probable phosphoglycerate mutase
MSGNLFDGQASAPRPAATGWFTAHCDGGSRGNPGPAGYGAVIEDPQGRVVARLSEYLGKQTNNYAEYSGLVAVLKWAVGNGVKRLRVVSDSELMVRQMKGQYKVGSPGLRPLWEEAQRVSRSLESFNMTHTLRAGNAEADRLANEAMDRGMGKSGEPGTREQGNKETRDRAGRLSDVSGPSQRLVNSEPRPEPRPERQVLEGYVKGGVVHLLEGELPDGIFVKVIRE